MWPDGRALYRIYQDDYGDVVEYRKVDVSNLAEAISCYKDQGLPGVHKLEVVETLLQRGYRDNHIDPEELGSLRKQILRQRIDRARNEGNLQAALRWEVRLQQLDYQPGRLENWPLDWAARDMDLVPGSNVLSAEVPGTWDLATGKACPLQPVRSEQRWDLMTDPKQPVCMLSPAAGWDLLTETVERVRVPFHFRAHRLADIAGAFRRRTNHAMGEN